jgi:hypothetical protein
MPGEADTVVVGAEDLGVVVARVPPLVQPPTREANTTTANTAEPVIFTDATRQLSTYQASNYEYRVAL